MSEIPLDVEAFKFDQYFWGGRHEVRWLEKDTYFIIYTDARSIPRTQIDALRFVCNCPVETRNKLAQSLFDYYQTEVYGAYHGGDEVTPPLTSAADILPLISQPTISIPSMGRIGPRCYFLATFECTWDPEHSIGVLFGQEAEPVDAGQSIDVS